MLRIKPTNTCIIQKLDCSTGDWVDWFDASCAVDGGAAPMREGVGTINRDTFGTPTDTTVDAGGCVEYDLVLMGNNQVLLPLPVTSGDLVTITNARGLVSATGDLPIINTAFYVGPAGNAVAADSSFPLPGTSEMRLIMNVDGSWYDAYNVTDFEVPSGVSDYHILFQVNDPEISDNLGSITFHVKVCKSTSSTWSKIFDFSGGDQQGWTAFSGLASWNGHGWDAVVFDDGAHTAAIITYPGPNPINATRMDIIGHMSGTSTDGNTTTVFDVNLGTHNSTIQYGEPGPDLIEGRLIADITSVQHAIIRMNGTGTGDISIVRLFGTGPNPF